ncbi:hypothetical protein [Streptomyces blattellae]|uniref:hypothetical protein n=1 Tax=Streptomyces blattellae TaxID=2569855 RepID=UPI0012B80FB5|nr:hypothetical protein [Streptomyces blattellae]
MPGSKTWVTGLTVGATAVVAVLAVQAGNGPRPTAAAAGPSASASASGGARPGPDPTASAPAAVPDASGTGRRIVYSLGQRRVWLVDESDAARRTFAVWPGTVAPDPGSYSVVGRRDATTGSDGVEVENIVYFATKSGLNIAFSNAVDGSSPPPPSGTPTGGIRMGRADGSAVWTFGSPGTTVVVVD